MTVPALFKDSIKNFTGDLFTGLAVYNDARVGCVSYTIDANQTHQNGLIGLIFDDGTTAVVSERDLRSGTAVLIIDFMVYTPAQLDIMNRLASSTRRQKTQASNEPFCAAESARLAS